MLLIEGLVEKVPLQWGRGPSYQAPLLWLENSPPPEVATGSPPGLLDEALLIGLGSTGPGLSSGWEVACLGSEVGIWPSCRLTGVHVSALRPRPQGSSEGKGIRCAHGCPLDP